MAKPKILFVLTSHDKLGDTGKPTGWFLPELGHPYFEVADKADVVVVSPKGGKAPLDPISVELFKDDAQSQTFLKEHSKVWETTEPLANYLGKASEFAAIFYVGGHGPMFDLLDNAPSQQLIREFYDAGKIVSAVCHGPIALANVTLADGSHLIAGQKVTGLTNEEEDIESTSSIMPCSLQDTLVARGARYESAKKPWEAHLSMGRGGRLLTGQNPASAGPLAKLLVEVMEQGPPSAFLGPSVGA